MSPSGTAMTECDVSTRQTHRLKATIEATTALHTTFTTDTATTAADPGCCGCPGAPDGAAPMKCSSVHPFASKPGVSHNCKFTPLFAHRTHPVQVCPLAWVTTAQVLGTLFKYTTSTQMASC